MYILSTSQYAYRRHPTRLCVIFQNKTNEYKTKQQSSQTV